MTMRISPSLPKDLGNTSSTFLQWWLKPRAVERDEAFRERVIRSTLGIMILLALLSFGSTIFLFESEWSLISFPSLHIVALLGCFAAFIAIVQQRLSLAGWLLNLTVLVGVSGIVILARDAHSLVGIMNGIASFMFVPIIATLVLPRNLILPLSLLSAGAYSLTQLGVQINTPELASLNASQMIITVILLLLVEGSLLRQLRGEFDARLDAMRDSIRQTELAKEQAEIDRRRAEEADKAKSQFLANMSHELRTPLNAIIGYSEAMLGGMAGEFTAQQKKLLGHIQHNSRRLLALINDILDLSKIESGSIELYLAPMLPRKIIQDTTDSLRSLVADKGIYLEVNFDPALPELVLGDANKLQQIVVNLVSNAIKFTETGGVRIDVRASSKGRWQFQVQDTGIGIPPEALNYIFEPFRQVDGTTTRKYKGTGLGLSITKRLIEKMEGTIEVDSEPGKGSTFTIDLPRVQIPEVRQQET